MTVALRVPLCENQEEPVFQLVEHVCHAARGVAEDRLDFSELHEKIMQLENLVFRLEEDRENAETILDRLAPEAIAGVNHAYLFWQTRLELQFADRLVKGEVSLSDYPLYDRFDGLIRCEHALLSDTGQHRLLFIGSGPLPVSAILLHLRTGWPIDCIAGQSGAVPLIQKILAK